MRPDMTRPDPDQLRAARGCLLAVQPDGEAAYLVTGGATAHRVTLDPLSCDCADAAYRPGSSCKHVLRVALHLHAPEAWATLAGFIRGALS